MSSAAASKTWAIAGNQFRYKLKGHLGLFVTMMAVQILAAVFSLAGTLRRAMSSDNISLSSGWITNDLIIIFTAGWAFYAAILLTSKVYRNIDFSMVSNRLTSSLADLGFILTAAMAGGITSELLGVALRVFGYFVYGSANIAGQYFFLNPLDLLGGILVCFLYILLAGALGYLIGTLAQVSPLLSPLMIALMFGTGFLEARSGGTLQIWQRAFGFFIGEGSFPLFAVKVMGAVVVMAAASMVLTQRMEVKKS